MGSVAGQQALSSTEWINAMAEIIAERFQPEKIILFGSQARGDADERSDVDLLIVLAGDVDPRAKAVEIRRAVRAIPLAKDIIVTTPEEIAQRGHVVGTVLRPALREGTVLYARP